MEINPKIRALIKKSNNWDRRHQFYWTEKDGEFKIIAEYGAIYDLMLWAQSIWGVDCNKHITALDEDGDIAYFKIGGRDEKKTSYFGIRT